MELFYTHLREVLSASGFLKPVSAVQMERKLRRLFNRAHVDQHELAILRGILSSVDPRTRREDDQCIQTGEDEQRA